MPVTLAGVVGTTANTGTGSVTGTYGQSPTSQNLLVAVITWFNETVTAFSPTETDTGSTAGTWRRLAGPFPNNPGSTSHSGVDFWVKTAAGGDATPVFKSAGAGTQGMTCVIFELAGANNTGPLDTSGSYSSGSTALTASPTMTPATAASLAAPGEFAISGFEQDNQAADTQTWTQIAAGWTSAFSDAGSTLAGHCQVNYQAGPPTGAALSDSGHFSTGTANIFASAGVVTILPAITGVLATIYPAPPQRAVTQVFRSGVMGAGHS